MSLFKRFEQNKVGRDFVVGDIHGCFSALKAGMDSLGFNPEIDRMFSVGDMVDRGPDSIDALEWLKYPYFHAIRGNHEQMCIDADPAMHVMNGGLWFHVLDDAKRNEIKQVFDQLPIAIEIDLGDGIAGLVHAEVPKGNWEDFKLMLRCSTVMMEHIERFALWGRDVICRRSPFYGVKGVRVVYVGHTPVKMPTDVENVRYIDTGACFGNYLSIVNVQTGESVSVKVTVGNGALD
jgi:serine/threonine protein phosphatase 1